MAAIKLTKDNIHEYVDKILLRKLPKTNESLKNYIFLIGVDDKYIHFYSLDDHLRYKEEFCNMLSIEKINEMIIPSDEELHRFLKLAKVINQSEIKTKEMEAVNIQKLIDKYGFDIK